jgi:hypothetical protein
MGAWREFKFDPLFGSLSEGNDSFDQHYASDLAEWAQFDVGYEYRSHGGVALRVAMGAAFMLDPGHADCRLDSNDSPVACDRSFGTASPSDPIYTLTLSIGPALGR